MVWRDARMLFWASLLYVSLLVAQPVKHGDNVLFRFWAPQARIVYLAGEFNSWNPRALPMQRDSSGMWIVELQLEPGVYQYKFVIDGIDWREDPNNPYKVDDNFGGYNSVLTITADGDVVLGELPYTGPLSDEYVVNGKLYLNIIWHQHQPLYLDPEDDKLIGPWVRAHATKDYYDMAAMLEKFPNVHCTINLTSVLLFQLQEYYVKRLGECVDLSANRVDTAKYWAKWGGRVDPWIDLALKPTELFTAEDDAYLYKNAWNAFGISDVMIERFPEYKALKEKGGNYSIDEKRQIKFWHYLAWFDPDFLRGPVKLATGYVCDLSDLVEERDGKFYLRHPVTEDDCNRIIAEVYKVCAAIIPIHKKLMYDPDTHQGQIEIITTPYYHPILPLICSTDIARVCQPGAPLPKLFSYPEDAQAQVAKAVAYYKSIFGKAPYGMWPAEGAVAENILSVLALNNILWMATGDGVLYRSLPGAPFYFPYRVDTDTIPGFSENALAIVFRNTELSDKIGFRYQRKTGEQAADDFIRSIIKYASPDEDRLLTVILDGENAWEWYRLDNDGKQFLHALYRKLSKLTEEGKVITVTPIEYIMGNPARGVPPHPVTAMPEIEPLWPGSWINANFDTWIGEDEENRAWEYLLQTRQDLGTSGIAPPDPAESCPDAGSPAYCRYMAWEEMYAAEGSDWFWWYGQDQGAPGGDKPFERIFLTHLKSVYSFMKECGWKGEMPQFEPILTGLAGGGGVMAESSKMVKVIFTCDARAINVPDAIYIAGEYPELGSWVPNKVRMYDDGTHGDEVAGDGIWTITFEFPVGTSVQYKYTNSGKIGVWSPSEEFPAINRKIYVRDEGNGTMIVRDIFGKMD